MQFQTEGTPVFIRMQAVDESVSDWADIGFQVTASGSFSGSAGYTDYQIIPQPIVAIEPSKRWGIPETQLQIDGIVFTISHNWVLSQMALFEFSNILSVFRDRRVMGIFWNNELHSIESITEDYAGGQVINWIVKTSAASLKVTG
jgi:hypothetical protein